MTYNLHDLMTASCQQLRVCLSRAVFMLQPCKLLQVGYYQLTAVTAVEENLSW
jgi:hypothetical protein